MEQVIKEVGRKPYQRTTLYGKPPPQQVAASFAAPELHPVSMGEGWRVAQTAAAAL